MMMKILQSTLRHQHHHIPRWTSTSATAATTKTVKDNMPESFMTRARDHGVQSLIGWFPASDDRFDKILKNVLHVDEITDTGNVLATLYVKDAMQNSYRSLHGGASALIVDIIGTMCFLGVDKNKPGVSLDINVSYPSAARADEKVIVKGKVLKMGKRIGFSEVTLYSQKGQVIATGRHTKAFA